MALQFLFFIFNFVFFMHFLCRGGPQGKFPPTTLPAVELRWKLESLIGVFYIFKKETRTFFILLARIYSFLGWGGLSFFRYPYLANESLRHLNMHGAQGKEDCQSGPFIKWSYF